MIAPRLFRLSGTVARRSQLSLQLRALSVSSVARASLPRSTLSTTWVPTGGMTASDEECQWFISSLGVISELIEL